MTELFEQDRKTADRQSSKGNQFKWYNGNTWYKADSYNRYHYCLFFDHGAALLSDTSMDYPLEQEVYPLMKEVKSNTFCSSFDEQLDIVEKLYGQRVAFHLKNRVEDILLYQLQKYSYLYR